MLSTDISSSFLDFFYQRLKPFELSNGNRAVAAKETELKLNGYTFISLCGMERNYVRSQDTPIVFRELLQRDNHREDI